MLIFHVADTTLNASDETQWNDISNNRCLEGSKGRLSSQNVLTEASGPTSYAKRQIVE